MVEIVDESFTSRFIKIKEQRENNTKKVLVIIKIQENAKYMELYVNHMVNWGHGSMCKLFGKYFMVFEVAGFISRYGQAKDDLDRQN